MAKEEDKAYSNVRIDNEPPNVPLSQYFKTNNYTGDASALSGLEEQNRRLIQLINVIYRTVGKVDNVGYFGLYSSTWDLRKSLAIHTERQNKELYQKILTAKSIYDRKFMQDDYLRKKRLFDNVRLNQGIEKKTIIDKVKDISIIPPNPPVEPDPCKRIRCWMDLEGRHERKPERTELDRLVIEVYLDMAPRSGENFVKMCRGDIYGFSYECTNIYKVYPGMFCVGGDVLKGNGVSGRSIFNVPFPNERGILEFNGPGVIGTYSEGDPGYTTSQFLISLSAVPSLKKYSVPFGRVISGFKTLERLSDLSKKSGNPFVNVIITKCGVACSDVEKLPYQPDFEIPDDIREHYERKEEYMEMDAKMRMLFLEQTRFYKQYGYMVKVNPDKRYPPLPWVEQPSDVTVPSESGQSGIAFIAEAEARTAEQKDEQSAVPETEGVSGPPPALPSTAVNQVTLDQDAGDGEIIRLTTASELASKSKEFSREPPTRNRTVTIPDEKKEEKREEKKKSVSKRISKVESSSGQMHEGESKEAGAEMSKESKDRKKKKPDKKKLKKKDGKVRLEPISELKKMSTIEAPRKPKYTGRGFSVRYPIKYLDEKDYQRCAKRCKETVFMQ